MAKQQSDTLARGLMLLVQLSSPRTVDRDARIARAKEQCGLVRDACVGPTDGPVPGQNQPPRFVTGADPWAHGTAWSDAAILNRPDFFAESILNKGIPLGRARWSPRLWRPSMPLKQIVASLQAHQCTRCSGHAGRGDLATRFRPGLWALDR